MAGNLKEVRERIGSVMNTQQITKAMKMVSAAKLRRAQTAIQQMRPYADKLNSMLRNILSNIEGDADTIFGQQRTVERACLVVVTSNRGLCGAFNTNIIKEAIKEIEGNYQEAYQAGKLTIIFIGKRGYDFLKKRYSKATIISDHVELFDDLNFDRVVSIAKGLMSDFENNQFDSIKVAYGRFKNAAVQYPEVEQWLPVAPLESGDSVSDSSMKADYLFEPNKTQLLNHLVPSILQTTLYKYLLDTHASEHGARMTAMDAATENANELLRELRISYNKARQEAITTEILEIVSGAAALESE
jgi:F-type H+-transporting ATPase subunit gamma